MVELDTSLDPDKMTPDEAKIRFDLACIDYIREPNKEAFDFISHHGHNMSILELVEALQPHVTSKQDDSRLNAVSLLIDVALQSTLKDIEVTTLVTFLCGRLSDKYNVLPKILSGITAFVKSRELESSVVYSIARHLFKCVDVQALHQDTRYKAYMLLHTLLHRNLLELLEGMNQEFALSYINTIDGEQDPRNLVIIFNMNVIVLQHFNIDGIEETLFDVISCYYPIDFTPPDDSDVAVTPELLRSHLNSCFKANNKLATYTIPFLLEKFGSSVIQTRIQTCDTLKLCIMSYGISLMEGFIKLIWNDIKREIFGGVNKDLRERCLEVLSAIFWVLTCPNIKSKDVDPAAFVNIVFEFCNEKMEYSETKYVKPSALILTAIVKSSGIGSGLVSEHCFPALLERFEKHTDTNIQNLLLEEIVNILTDMQCEPSRATAAVEHLEWNRLETLFLTVISDYKSPELCVTGVSGIEQLLNIYHLTDKHTLDTPPLNISTIVLGVYQHLCKQTASADSGLQVLTMISREYPDIVNSLLLAKLLDKVEAGEAAGGTMLSRLLVGNLLIQHSPRLMRYFSQHQDTDIITLFTIAISYQESAVVLKYCQEFLFTQILHLFVQAAISEQASSLNTESAVLLFQDFIVALFKNRSTRPVDLVVWIELFKQSAVFKPFHHQAPARMTRLTAIFNAVLTYGAADNTFDPSITTLDMKDSLTVACNSTDPLTVRALSSAIGLVLNRLEEGGALEHLTEQVYMELETCTLTNNRVWLAVRACQGLVYRWNVNADKAVREFVRCLTNEQTHAFTANLTYHVLDPIYQGRRMVLYKQRFLLSLIPLVTPFVKEPSLLSDAVYCSLVRGIGTLLLALPQSLVGAHGNTLYPIILNGLTPGNCDTGSLKLVQHLITNIAGIVILNLDTLISRLCALSVSCESSVQCRVEALRTIYTCATQLHHKHTHVHRTFVVKEVTVALGDRKRVVRGAATETLQLWIMLQP